MDQHHTQGRDSYISLWRDTDPLPSRSSSFSPERPPVPMRPPILSKGHPLLLTTVLALAQFPPLPPVLTSSSPCLDESGIPPPSQHPSLCLLKSVTGSQACLQPTVLTICLSTPSLRSSGMAEVRPDCILTPTLPLPLTR